MYEKAKGFFKTVFTGKFLLALRFDKYLDRIVYMFGCALIFIWINLQIDKTMHVKKENSVKIENLRSMHTNTTCTLTALNSVCEVERLLKKMGSNVEIPQKKAERIK